MALSLVQNLRVLKEFKLVGSTYAFHHVTRRLLQLTRLTIITMCWSQLFGEHSVGNAYFHVLLGSLNNHLEANRP